MGREASCKRGGEVAEVVMVEEEEMRAAAGGGGGGLEAAEEEVSGVVRWERFLPRVSVRVLLVESDDSTRQIVSALLRKCSYKVIAASDGLKAWEILKENSHNIDLVLTEVELPSISGFALLNMIMDHESCKNIPVIMMSSHDSISMVFKCMTKGAADFLVKPIRKNELRNLWQHVWRRHISSSRHEGTYGHQDENLAKNKLDNCPGEYITCLHENKECSEKGSDAQSSCTRSDIEAESTYMQNMLDINQHKSRNLSLMTDGVAQNNEEHIQSDSASLIPEVEAEGVSPFNGACNSNEPTLDEDQHYAVMETLNDDKPSADVIDLIGVMGNQPRCSYVTGDITAVQIVFSDASETLIHEKDAKCKSSSMPHLELSLRRYQQSSHEKPESDELNTLNHSNSSAFSLYNSRISVPTSVPPINSTTWTKSGLDKDSGNASNSPNISMEDAAKSLGLGLTSQEGVTVGCSPIGAIPFPIPMRGMSFDGLCAGYGTVMQPIYYPQAANPLWSAIPSMWQEAVNTNPSHQPDHPKDPKSVQRHHPDDQNPKSVIQDPAPQEEKSDEPRNVSSGTVESCEGIKQTDFHHLNQREAALNKFRLKRKDRCYEKKVRYHSRKKLAEQRPRVKGQFVRQV